MNVITEEDYIKVQVEFCPAFIKKVKQIGGFFHKPYWFVPIKNKAQLKELLLDIFGECNSLEKKKTDTVDVLINLDQYYFENVVLIGELPIAARQYRDSSVKLVSNAYLISGGFNDRGGSARYPAVNPLPNTVLRVDGLPISLYDKIRDQKGVQLISEYDAYIHSLIVEKKRLEKRIEKINSILNHQ